MRGHSVFRLVAGIAALVSAPAAFGQGAVSTQAAAADGESVTVTGKPTRRMVYEFFQQLNDNDVCMAGGSWTPRGHSCAEVTYDVFDKEGKHLGRCNVPIFRLYAVGFGYWAVTFEKFDCTNPPERRDLTAVLLSEMMDPRTADATVFRKVSVLGLDQAKELCKISSDLCVTPLFNHTQQLSKKALGALWDGRGTMGPH